ncbi:MAG TPA: M14 family zinc carboxypeptidase, partial [bacterium]|nr:M14 family zinc carboxypeptidase [bacterium]
MKQTGFYFMLFCLIAITIGSAAGLELPDMRIKIRVDQSGDIQTLRAMRIDADYRDGDWLVAEVREEEYKRIRHAGFTVEIVEPDLAAERAMYKARGQHRDYHTYESLRQEMLTLEATYPNLAQFIVTGQSVQGRDIMTIKISDNVTVDEAEPEIRWEGNIHGDEKIAMEVAIYLVNELISNYGSDPQITDIVDNREIFFTPSVNPDGMTLFQRYNANGVDCNRDYGYMWDGWGGSSAPWSQPETQAILNLIMDNQFIVGMSGHSGTEIFLYSWCYTEDQTWDEAQHDDVQNAYSALSGYSGGQCSYVLYPVNGGSMDADYAMTGAMGVCVEISYQKTPPVSEIDDYCLQNRAAALDMFERVGNGINGVVTDLQTGEPIPALVEVIEIGWPVYCDPVVGDYHRFLLPGTYSLRVWANDYEPVVIPSVVVPATGAVTVDVQLDRGIDSAAYKVIYCRDNQPSYNNHTQTADALGPVDGEYYSICVDGYICMDMGETTPIIDYPGFDFTVWEGDATAEGYTVAVANAWNGPWVTVGTGMGTTEFDLDGTGLDTARFVKITDDGDGSASGSDPGFDLDAITTVHVVPGCGVLEMDREKYACEDTVAISLIDADLNVNPGSVDTATVLVTSDSDPQGETVVVTESGPDTSEFYGDVTVQEGSGGSGYVGVHHGDMLTVTYDDADCEGQPQTVEITADIDCAGPVISG